jgi:hypothetical protein
MDCPTPLQETKVKLLEFGSVDFNINGQLLTDILNSKVLAVTIKCKMANFQKLLVNTNQNIM